MHTNINSQIKLLEPFMSEMKITLYGINDRLQKKIVVT